MQNVINKNFFAIAGYHIEYKHCMYFKSVEWNSERCTESNIDKIFQYMQEIYWCYGLEAPIPMPCVQ